MYAYSKEYDLFLRLFCQFCLVWIAEQFCFYNAVSVYMLEHYFKFYGVWEDSYEKFKAPHFDTTKLQNRKERGGGRKVHILRTSLAYNLWLDR